MSSKSPHPQRLSPSTVKYYTTQIGCTSFRIDTRYQNLSLQGDGSFDCVVSAFDTVMNRRVAIKKIRSPLSELHHLKRILREVILLRHFITHENVVSIYDIMTDPPDVPDFEDIYIVTNLFETDLEKIIGSNENNLTDHHLQFFMYQILRGLKFIHSANVIHRDLKPSNLLVNSSCDLAICDFGLGRGLNSIYENPLTQYVVTRYYRAPELLCESNYGKPIDIWSVGCIFAEMITRAPFFTGDNPQEQLKCIVYKLGIPPKEKLNFIKSRTALSNILATQTNSVPHFAMNFPNGTSFLALDLIRQMLEINPSDRIAVEDALKHPYLKNFHDLVSEPVCQNIFNFNFDSSSHSSVVSEAQQQVMRQAKKSRSDDAISNAADLAIGDTLAKAFMTSVFGKVHDISPKAATTGLSVVSPRFPEMLGHNRMSNNETISARMSTGSTDQETSEATSNDFHRMKKLTNDQISIREAKFLILQEVKIYRKLSPAILSFLTKESTSHMSRSETNIPIKSHSDHMGTGHRGGISGSLNSSSSMSHSQSAMNALMNNSQSHVVSPRLSEHANTSQNHSLSSSHRERDVATSSSSSSSSSSSGSYAHTPHNFFANQYALALGNNFNDHNRNYINYNAFDNNVSASNHPNMFPSSYRNEFLYSEPNRNNSIAMLSNNKQLSVNNSNNHNNHEPTTLSDSTDNQSIFSSNHSRSPTNATSASASNPVPVCENFQWLANGSDDDGNDVDLLFDVSIYLSVFDSLYYIFNETFYLLLLSVGNARRVHGPRDERDVKYTLDSVD